MMTVESIEITPSLEVIAGEIFQGKRRITKEEFLAGLTERDYDSKKTLTKMKNEFIVVATPKYVYEPFCVNLISLEDAVKSLVASLEEAPHKWKGKGTTLKEDVIRIGENAKSFRSIISGKDWDILHQDGINVIKEIHKIQDKIDLLENELENYIQIEVRKATTYSIAASMLTGKSFDVSKGNWRQKGVAKIITDLKEIEGEIDQAIHEELTTDDLEVQFKKLFHRDSKPDFVNLDQTLIGILDDKGLIRQQIIMTEKLSEKLNSVFVSDAEEPE